MQIKCPACSKVLNVPDSAAGKVIKCPCGKQIRAGGAKPAQGATPAKPAAPAPAQPAPAQPNPVQATPQQPAIPKRGELPPGHPLYGIGQQEMTGTIFDEMTDQDLQPVKGVQRPGVKQAVKKKGPDPLAEHAKDLDKSKREKKKRHREGAASYVRQSIGLLLFLGFIAIGVNTYELLWAETNAEAYLGSDAASEDEIGDLVFAIQVVCGVRMTIGGMFLLCAAAFFKFPMTSSIMGIVAFVLSEIVATILNPILLISLVAWIVRAIIFGALLQAINNASYYKFVKKGGRDNED